MTKKNISYLLNGFRVEPPKDKYEITMIYKGDTLIGFVGDSMKDKFEPSIVRSKKSKFTDSLGITPTLEQAINAIVDEADFRGY